MTPPALAVESAPRSDPKRYARWRAAVLIGVHVLIGLHIAHWMIAGRSLAPLELNELMYTLEAGIVTAGFLLMAAVALSVAVFGRFFCSWACHMLALQDLAAWLLARVGISAKPVRSRVLRVAPFVALFYMFVWPQLARLARGEPLPGLRIASSSEPWSSFVTEDFWRNLPGPWIAGLTFAICGFAVVYLLGSRAFCANACPYGAAFGLLDRIAPGRIVAKGDCTNCGMCTAVCQSGVRVHEEVQRFGMVVDANCLKDMDCVAVCPEQALGFGFRVPALFVRKERGATDRSPSRASLAEDLLAGAVTIATLLVFRGLYDAVPFLMSLGLGVTFAWLAVLTRRLMTRDHMVFRGLTLRRGGRLAPAGRALGGLAAAAGLLTLHSGFVRYHEYRGDLAYQATRVAVQQRDAAAVRRHVQDAIAHLETCASYGLLVPIEVDRRLADLHAYGPCPERTLIHLGRVLDADPASHETRLRRCFRLIHDGRFDEAERDLALVDAVAFALPTKAHEGGLLTNCVLAHERLAAAHLAAGDESRALEHRRRIDALRIARSQ